MINIIIRQKSYTHDESGNRFAGIPGAKMILWDRLLDAEQKQNALPTDRQGVLQRVSAEYGLLRLCGRFGNDFRSLVETAVLAYTVSKIDFAALRAFYKVGGSFQFPNAGASLHLSGMGNLFLRYCHFFVLLMSAGVLSVRTVPPYVSLLFFFMSSRIFRRGASRGSGSFSGHVHGPSFRFFPHRGHRPLQSSRHKKRIGNSISNCS